MPEEPDFSKEDEEILDTVWSKLMAERDPARIDRIIESLKNIWKQYPDLRFGQIIELVVGRVSELKGQKSLVQMYYVEDDIFQRALESLGPQQRHECLH